MGTEDSVCLDSKTPVWRMFFGWIRVDTDGYSHTTWPVSPDERMKTSPGRCHSYKSAKRGKALWGRGGAMCFSWWATGSPAFCHYLSILFARYFLCINKTISVFRKISCPKVVGGFVVCFCLVVVFFSYAFGLFR